MLKCPNCDEKTLKETDKLFLYNAKSIQCPLCGKKFTVSKSSHWGVFIVFTILFAIMSVILDSAQDLPQIYRVIFGFGFVGIFFACYYCFAVYMIGLIEKE